MSRSLEDIVRAQAETYGELVEAIALKREAIRTAKLDHVPAIAEHEATLIERLRELDINRMKEADKLCKKLGIEDGTVSSIVEALPKEEGERLASLAAMLCDRIETAKRESSNVRAAGEALSMHMAGVMQSVRGVLATAGVYGRQGNLRTGVTTMSGLDVSS